MRIIALFATYCLLSFCYSSSTNADIVPSSGLSPGHKFRSLRSSVNSPAHEKQSESFLKQRILQGSPLALPETDRSRIQQVEVRDAGSLKSEEDEEVGVTVKFLRAVQTKLEREEMKSLYFTSEEVFSREYGSDPKDEIRHLRKKSGTASGPLPRFSGWNETFCGLKRQPWLGQEQIQLVRRNWKIFGVEEKRGDPSAEAGAKDENDEMWKRIPPELIIGSSKDLEGIDQVKFSNNPSCQDIKIHPSSTFSAPSKAAPKSDGKTSAPSPLIVDLSSQIDLINKIISSLYNIRDIAPSKFRRLTYDCSFPIPEWAALICRIPTLSFGLCNEKNELPCKTYIKHVGTPEQKSQGPKSICPIKKNGATEADKTGTLSDHRTSGLVDVRWGAGCEVSHRFADLPKADAVIFNADMFASLYAHQYQWIDPTNWTVILRPSVRRSRNQLWGISMHGEAATTHPYIEDLEFLKHFDYSSGHDRRFFQFHAPSNLASKRNAHLFTSTNSRNHPLNPKYTSYPSDPAPIVLVNSRCDTASYREEYVKELMKYIRVDTYGNCDNDGKLEERPELFRKLGEVEDASDANDINSQTAKGRKIIQGYRFNLVIESSICFDYVSEKFYDALQIDSTVPIYLGAPNIDDYSPVPVQGSHPPAYVSALDFASPKELADHVYALLRDPTEYESHFQWKRRQDGNQTEELLRGSGLWREMEMLESSEGFGCEICWRVKVSKCLAGSR